MLAGNYHIFEEVELKTELKAFNVALRYLNIRPLTWKHTFTSCIELYGAINKGSPHNAWRIEPEISIANYYLNNLGNTLVHVIPRSWVRITFQLAIHGASLHELTLFHQGRILLKWIMKDLKANGLTMQFFYLFFFVLLFCLFHSISGCIDSLCFLFLFNK